MTAPEDLTCVQWEPSLCSPLGATAPGVAGPDLCQPDCTFLLPAGEDQPADGHAFSDDLPDGPLPGDSGDGG